MPGGKGKSTGGKAGPKAAEGKTQKSHSAKAGLQVSLLSACRRAVRGDSLYRTYMEATQSHTAEHRVTSRS